MRTHILHLAAYLAHDDGAPRTMAALDDIISGATPPAEITLVSVVVPSGSRRVDDLLPFVDLAEREARQRLNRYAAQLPGCVVHRVVLVGDDPATEVLHWLAETHIDALVLSRPPRRRWSMPSSRDAVSRLLQRSPVPVMLAPAQVPARLPCQPSRLATSN